jgi:hypothetical protein
MPTKYLNIVNSSVFKDLIIYLAPCDCMRHFKGKAQLEARLKPKLFQSPSIANQLLLLPLASSAPDATTATIPPIATFNIQNTPFPIITSYFCDLLLKTKHFSR